MLIPLNPDDSWHLRPGFYMVNGVTWIKPSRGQSLSSWPRDVPPDTDPEHVVSILRTFTTEAVALFVLATEKCARCGQSMPGDRQVAAGICRPDHDPPVHPDVLAAALRTLRELD